MNFPSFFQVSGETEEVSVILKEAFIPPLNGFPDIIRGKLELDFKICVDGSIILNRLTSTNADLYSYFRSRLAVLRLTNLTFESDRDYTLQVSFSPKSNK
jgi:hypothetical protein